MAFQITPGYDFTVNEIPTRGKLQQMAAGLSLTGIVAAQMEGVTLIHLKTTADSAVSLPSNGWMWVDEHNTLWVKTSKGNVRLYRGWGGWESIRYPTVPGDSVFTMPYRGGEKRFLPRTLVVGDSNESNIRLRASDNGRVVAVNVDTASSGVHETAVYRGGAILLCVPTGVVHPFYVTRGNASQDDMNETRWPATNANSLGLGPKIGIAERVFSDAGGGGAGLHMGWIFGGELMQY